MLNRTQKIVLLIFLGLFVLLYFGLDTKPKEHQLVEKSRALNLESTNISNLLIEAKETLDNNDQDLIHALEVQLKASQSDDEKTRIMERLSSKWFDTGHEAISGFYAEEIANIAQTENAWSIAGTTYILCIRNADTEKVKRFCAERGKGAIETAISLNPDEVNHKVNLAVCLAEFPPKDNPMQGIMMLLDLNREHPDHVGTLYQLARFGLQTKQYDKAIGRLNRILEIDPSYKRANCLLAKIYEEMNNLSQAALFQEKCLN